MHPILGYPRRLGLYLITWLILSELLFYVATYHLGGIDKVQSALFFLPLLGRHLFPFMVTIDLHFVRVLSLFVFVTLSFLFLIYAIFFIIIVISR